MAGSSVERTWRTRTGTRSVSPGSCSTRPTAARLGSGNPCLPARCRTTPTGVCFVDPQHGWVLRPDGRVRQRPARTVDGGHTWDFQYLRHLAATRARSRHRRDAWMGGRLARRLPPPAMAARAGASRREDPDGFGTTDYKTIAVSGGNVLVGGTDNSMNPLMVRSGDGGASPGAIASPPEFRRAAELHEQPGGVGNRRRLEPQRPRPHDRRRCHLADAVRSPLHRLPRLQRSAADRPRGGGLPARMGGRRSRGDPAHRRRVRMARPEDESDRR